MRGLLQRSCLTEDRWHDILGQQHSSAMTTALPSVHRGSAFASNHVGLPSYPGHYAAPVNASCSPCSTDEGDGGVYSSSLGMPYHAGPSFIWAGAPTSPGRSYGHPLAQPPPPPQQPQQPLSAIPEGVHRFARDRLQNGGSAAAAPTAGRGPVAPAPYAAYQPAAAVGAAASGPLTPERFRGALVQASSDQSETASGSQKEGGGGGSGGGGGGCAGSPSGRLLTYDAFVRPGTTTTGGDRRRLFTGSSQDLLRGAGASPPTTPTLQQQLQLQPASAPWGDCGHGMGSGGSGGGRGAGSLRRWAQPSWLASPGTPSVSASTVPVYGSPNSSSGSGGGGSDSPSSRGRSRGLSGGVSTLGRSQPTSPREVDPVVAPFGSVPPCGPHPGAQPSPRLLHIHPGGLGAAAMTLIATGHHMSRQQVLAQARGVERLLALDMEEVLGRATTPREVATLTPGSLDGLGHPVLLAADGARILKRIPDHLPRHVAERMATAAMPLRPEHLHIVLSSNGLDADLDLGGLDPYSPDGGGGGSSYDEADYGPPLRGGRASGGNGTSPYMSLAVEGSIAGGMGLSGGGGGRPGTHATGVGRRGGGGGGTGDGSGPLRAIRSWSSPSRNLRGAGGVTAVHQRTETLDGSTGLAAESSRASRIGIDVRVSQGGGGGGGRVRRASRSPPPTRDGTSAGAGRVSPGRGSSPGGGRTGGGRQSAAGDEIAPPPKWLGTYIPKEDPLGLWMGKRMSKTEVIVEKRLFAMRHNPGMRLELESRAAEALRQRAAAQAEMAAVTRAREEEALARKAQLRAEIEARKRGWSPGRELERTRSRTPKGLTKEAKLALERRLLAEAAAEPRGPLSRDEAAAIIQATWRMYCQRRRYLHVHAMVVRIQRAARLRYCVIRNRRRHAAAASLLLDFLCAIGGSRHAAAAMDLREVHSNYLRRRLLEKKGDLRHQTAVAVLVREWDCVEARILGLRNRSLKGTALAAMAAVTGLQGPSAAGGGAGAGSGQHRHRSPGGGTGGGGGASGGEPKDMLTAVAGETRSAAHGTRLLGKALEARKKGVMLLAGGKDLNKQLTVEYAVFHSQATDRVIRTSREPVPGEVKALVAACYLEHKAIAYTAFIGVVWKRRARWYGVFRQQRHMAMARSVVETGSAWQAMDALAKEATEKLVGALPVLPRMRTSATLRELRALMQAGVQEADLYTSYMLKGGIHELERRLHSEMLLRNSFGHLLRGGRDREGPRELAAQPQSALVAPGTAASDGTAGTAGASPSFAGGGVGGGSGGQRRWTASNSTPTSGPASPGLRGASISGTGSAGGGSAAASGGGGAGPTGQPVPPLVLPTSSPPTAESPRRQARAVRIDTGTAAPATAAADAPDTFPDNVSEAGSGVTSLSNLSVLGQGRFTAAGAGIARERFMAMMATGGNRAGVAQLRERWWREAVVRVDACLRKRYKLNGVSLVACLEDPTAPNVDFFSSKLAEINSNPEKAEALLAALPGAVGTANGGFSAGGGGGGGGAGAGGGNGGGSGKPRTSMEGTWHQRAP